MPVEALVAELAVEALEVTQAGASPHEISKHP
jgi:hypothetical protein